MGVGKSTTGKALADALGWSYSDSDTEIVRLTGLPGRLIAERSGVPALHLLEAAALLGALVRPTRHVITAAASVVENKVVLEVLATGAFVVRLTAAPEVTLARQLKGDHRRSMTAGELRELESRRESLFAGVEDVVLDADHPTRELVGAIIEARGSEGIE